MSFRFSHAIVLISLPFSLSYSVAADTFIAERSDDITLTSLTDNVYQQHPLHHNEQALHQQINANKAISDANFSGASQVSLMHQNDVIGSDDGLQEWEGGVALPLWLPGQRQQQVKLTEHMAAEIPAYKQKIRLESSALVRELIWQVVLAETAVKQSLQAWEAAQTLEQDVNSRVKAGELAGTEYLLATTNSIELHSQYVLANSKLKQIVQRYTLITGEAALPSHYEERLGELAQGSDSINQLHPALVMLAHKVNTLRAQQDLAQFENAVNPSLSIGVRRERDQRGDNFNNSMGVGISFALDDKVYRQPAIASAAKALADAEIERQQIERVLNISLQSALNELEAKRQQQKLMLEQNSVTQRYLTLQQRAFDLGEINLVSLLRSQVLANETQNRQQRLDIEIKQLIATVNHSLGLTL